MEKRQNMDGGKMFGDLASLFFFQTVARIMHMVLGMIIIQFIDPSVFGISNLQIPFITMMLTRIFKEALHRFGVKSMMDSTSGSAPVSQRLRVVWQAVPLVIFGSIIISLIYVQFKVGMAELVQSPFILPALICWLINGWAEMAVEPVIMFLEFRGLVKISALVECTSLLIQSAFITLMLIFGSNSEYLMNFLFPSAQFVYGTGLFVFYYGYAYYQKDPVGEKPAKRMLAVIWPGLTQILALPSSVELTNLRPWVFQSLGKYVTAEGEHALLFFFADSYQQGIFEFVNNLGSMVARIAFLSLERIGFLNFQRTASPSAAKERQVIWKTLLSFSVIISTTYLATCPAFIDALIGRFYGPKWSETPAAFLLSIYGVYLLVMGINGLVESLRDAVASRESLESHNSYLFFSISFHFCLGAAGLSIYGALGLILASVISTSARLLINIFHFSGQLLPIRHALPSVSYGVLIVTVAVVGQIAKQQFGNSLRLLFFGAGLAIFYAVGLLWTQRAHVKQVFSLVKSSRNKQE